MKCANSNAKLGVCVRLCLVAGLQLSLSVWNAARQWRQCNINPHHCASVCTDGHLNQRPGTAAHSEIVFVANQGPSVVAADDAPLALCTLRLFIEGEWPQPASQHIEKVALINAFCCQRQFLILNGRQTAYTSENNHNHAMSKWTFFFSPPSSICGVIFYELQNECRSFR